MSTPISYNDALEDCLDVMRSGGDLRNAVARYPQHADALGDDVRIAYALRRAAFSVVPPEGAETRASLRLANALREARPAQRASASPFGWLTGALRPIAVAGVAVVALVAFGLGATGNVSNPLGGATSAEASTVEGVVVENRDGTLTLETAQGLTKVDLNQKPMIQDDMAKLLTIGDIEAGQVVRIEAKKTPQGALVAKQINRKPITAVALQDWCTDNGDACHEVAPRLEAVSTQCRPGDQQCLRIQQSVTNLQQGLKALMQRITELKNRCGESRDAPACRQLMQVCKDHPLVCADLKIRPANGLGGGQGNPGQGGQQRPQNAPQQRPNSTGPGSRTQ
jgi:hypothetical protein